MAPGSTLPQWFTDAVQSLAKKNVDGWMAIYAPDAVHEFPFVPEGVPKRFEGYSAIEACAKSIFEKGLFNFGRLENIRVHVDSDTQTIAEADGFHTLPDGTPFEMSYLWMITRRDGKVVLFKEYINPLQFPPFAQVK